MKDLKNSFVYKEKDPIDSNGDMSLTIGSLIKISNLVLVQIILLWEKMKIHMEFIKCICINIQYKTHFIK